MILRLLAGYRRRPTNHRQSQLSHSIHSFRSHRLPYPDPGTGQQHSPAIAVAFARLSLVRLTPSDNVLLIRGRLPHNHDAFSYLKAFHVRCNPVPRCTGR